MPKPYPMLKCQVQVFHLHLSLILWPPSLPPSPSLSLSPFVVYGHSHVVATKCVAMPWVKWTYCLCSHPHALLMGSLLILVMNSVALGKVLACRRFVRAIYEVLMGMFVSLDCMQYRRKNSDVNQVGQCIDKNKNKSITFKTFIL